VDSLRLLNVRKSYGTVSVLNGISLTMSQGEFIAFLGPSGSGKSTLLRIIAGLETADAGEVWLGDRRIDNLAPGARSVAMVFQNYALYPHMSVRDNMAFGLVNAGLSRSVIEERIEKAATALELTQLLQRKPGQLSGGQAQRVAIGRAIVKAPQLFLLDEPLSNLDAALRGRTRVELAQLRQRVDAAFIMVTHDQSEAMTLADRIVVMNEGIIQQVGAPMDVYARPANRFVAGFVGSPAMVVAPVGLVDAQGAHAAVKLGNGDVIQTRIALDSLSRQGRSNPSLQIGLRPENVQVCPTGQGSTDGTVVLVERLGDRTLVHAQLSDGQDITGLDGGLSKVRIGDKVGLLLDGAATHLFEADGKALHSDPVT
jgi:multiple sugar transport system ATP-binding protein